MRETIKVSVWFRPGQANGEANVGRPLDSTQVEIRDLECVDAHRFGN